jgi:hypothetical protein
VITFAFRTFTLFTNMVIGTGLAIPIIAICVVTGWWVGSRNLKRALLNSETQ